MDEDIEMSQQPFHAGEPSTKRDSTAHQTHDIDSPLDDFTFGWSFCEEDKDDEESHQRDDMAYDGLGLGSSDEGHEMKAPKRKKEETQLST
ncbi:uncharacterized protein ARMOST_22561 [Armillaria ostoyae]|uniref:Uncharacterized protein n=1 Tax=Armillaria ostoyae TaxID=47428 RepID=A0A284SD74_ARMOS|nr:uncharacterized protein ARMOST_22561 [Armillaria ostoyae]